MRRMSRYDASLGPLGLWLAASSSLNYLHTKLSNLIQLASYGSAGLDYLSSPTSLHEHGIHPRGTVTEVRLDRLSSERWRLSTAIAEPPTEPPVGGRYRPCS